MPITGTQYNEHKTMTYYVNLFCCCNAERRPEIWTWQRAVNHERIAGNKQHLKYHATFVIQYWC